MRWAAASASRRRLPRSGGGLRTSVAIDAIFWRRIFINDAPRRKLTSAA